MASHLFSLSSLSNLRAFSQPVSSVMTVIILKRVYQLWCRWFCISNCFLMNRFRSNSLGKKSAWVICPSQWVVSGNMFLCILCLVMAKFNFLIVKKYFFLFCKNLTLFLPLPCSFVCWELLYSCASIITYVQIHYIMHNYHNHSTIVTPHKIDVIAGNLFRLVRLELTALTSRAKH